MQARIHSRAAGLFGAICALLAMTAPLYALAHSCERPLLGDLATTALSSSVHLRPLSVADVDQLVQISQEPEAKHLFFFGEASAFANPDRYRDQLLDFAEDEASKRHGRMFVIEFEGRVVGSVGIWFGTPEGLEKITWVWPIFRYAHIGRMLDRSVWSKGVGTEIYRG